MSRGAVFTGVVSLVLITACNSVAAPSTTSSGSGSPASAPPSGSASPGMDFSRLPAAVGATPLLWLSAETAVSSDAKGRIDEWKGAGGTARAAANNERPSLVADGIGGRPAIQFDGKDDQLEVSEVNINPSVHPDLTVVTVFASDVDEAEDPFRKLYGHDDEGFDRSAGLDTRGMRNYTLFGGETGGVVGYFNLEANTPYITVDAWHATSVQGWVNGKSMLGTGWPVDNAEGLPTFFIGGTGTVFREPWQGKIAEMFVFDGALADPARVALEEFLRLKYAIELEQ
jgi:hypothetical protein